MYVQSNSFLSEFHWLTAHLPKTSPAGVYRKFKIMKSNHFQQVEWFSFLDWVSQKKETLDFRYFDIQQYSIFWFHQIKHCLLKRMIPRSLKLDEQFWFYGNFSKHSHHQYSLILMTFLSGIMAFLTSIHCSPEAHWSVQTKQRENLWTAIPAVSSSHRFNKSVPPNLCVCFKQSFYS